MMNYPVLIDDAMLAAEMELLSAATCTTLFTLGKLDQEEEG